MADSDFRKAMRLSESSGNMGILNDIGDGRIMAGGYQFSEPRLRDYMNKMGVEFEVEDFAKDPDLQERVMDWHEQDIMDLAMERGLDRFIGTEVGGVQVTPSAIVGMAHLGGNGGMRDFLVSGGKNDQIDKYGTRISDYGKKFTGMNMYGLTPVRPQARPEGLLPVDPNAPIRPRMRPQRGILD